MLVLLSDAMMMQEVVVDLLSADYSLMSNCSSIVEMYENNVIEIVWKICFGYLKQIRYFSSVWYASKRIHLILLVFVRCMLCSMLSFSTVQHPMELK